LGKFVVAETVKVESLLVVVVYIAVKLAALCAESLKCSPVLEAQLPDMSAQIGLVDDSSQERQKGPAMVGCVAILAKELRFCDGVQMPDRERYIQKILLSQERADVKPQFRT
jgi:hypothetical protein